MDEFSWFVGLYEGEGTFQVNKNNSYQTSIRISMTDEDTIARAAGFLGISYRFRHPPSWKSKGWKPQWFFEYKGLKSIDMIKKMLPYLSKRRQEQVREKLELREKNVKPLGRPRKT